MKRAAIFVLLSVAVLTPSSSSRAQDEPDTAQQQLDVLRVYLDCQTRCDFSHIRREITFVNWVRDRRDAQVHVLVTSQRTGSGGWEFFFDFIGLKEFDGRRDTLFLLVNSTDTESEGRDGQTQTLKLGLIPFVANLPMAQDIRINYELPELELVQQTQPEDDPWNLWVFRVGMNARLNGESQRNVISLNGSISASRVTEDWKHNFRAGGSYLRREVELSTGNNVFTDRNYNARGSTVKSLGNHWSTGVRASIATSTFSNLDRLIEGGPALEFDIFPYSESTRRQIVFFYTIQIIRFEYEQLTVLNEIAETRLQQELEIAAEFVQPWGGIDAELDASSYLHDPSLFRLGFDGSFNIRLFRGFNFRVNGDIAWIRDQISLPAEEASDEDILLGRVQLPTDFFYGVSFGFSYQFGSIYNNVVNPRMRGF